MWNFILLAFLLKSMQCQDSLQAEDMLIENFVPLDLQENDMDLELLPRSYRSFDSEDDNSPKEYFFRPLEAQEDSENIPKPGGLNIYNYQVSARRSKRQTDTSEVAAINGDKNKNIQKPALGLVKSLGKPLELSELNPENTTTKIEEIPVEIGTTESVTTVPSIGLLESKQDQDNVLINDFIRFRRSTNHSNNNNTQGQKNEARKEEQGRSNQEIFNGHSEKLVMEPLPTDTNKESSRSQQEWVKQLYPGRRRDELSFEDNVPASSEAIRAPRVNFVTQKLSEPPALPEFRSFDREPRGRFLREPEPYIRDMRYLRDMADLTGDFTRDVDYYQPRHTRPYPIRHPGDFRDDPYQRYEYRPREIYRPRYQNYEIEPSANYKKPKQKRIIYYATLPEVPRASHDRYGYREPDRYDDPYAYRNKDFGKSRGKPPYPVKVSTDVNVREVKKNPERRIYSEVDNGRYPFKQDPYPENSGAKF